MEILVTSIIAFASTNIDDLFLLTLFFGNKKLKTAHVITGQYLGISTLIILSLIGSLIGLLIDLRYVGLLGFVPIYLGIHGMWSLYRKRENADSDSNPVINRTGALAVAGITIANGGDNIGVYIPLFSSIDRTDKGLMIIVFLLMTWVWCMTAMYFTKHPYVAKTVDRYGHVVTPFVLILLGIYIFMESNTSDLLK